MSIDARALVTAFIKPHLEGRVVRALHELPDFPGFSLVEARGQGRGKGSGGPYYAEDHDLTYQRHLALVIACASSQVDAIVEAVAQAAHTGRKGDGVILVSPLISQRRISEHLPASTGAPL